MPTTLTRHRITPNMRIEDILARFPQCGAVFEAYGLTCLACHAGKFENLGQGARVHGIDIPTLLHELNQAALTARSPQ